MVAVRGEKKDVGSLASLQKGITGGKKKSRALSAHTWHLQTHKSDGFLLCGTCDSANVRKKKKKKKESVSAKQIALFRHSDLPVSAAVAANAADAKLDCGAAARKELHFAS